VRTRSVFAPATIGAMLLLAVSTQAAEIKVFSAAALTPPMKELTAQFERTTGHKVTVKYVVGPAVKREIDAGEPFDVAVSVAPVLDELIKAGKIVPDTRADVARAGVGVGVRAGAAKPDIGSVEAFKRALLDANAVAHSSEGASGVYFKGLLERLGIAEQMQAKLRPMGAGRTVEPVQKGEADFVVVTISAMMVPGIEVVGPLPAELQTYVAFAAGVGAEAKEPEAARALVKFISSEEAVPVLKAKGMEPGGR
jgi:molybdate transport system substrate-binding protein